MIDLRRNAVPLPEGTECPWSEWHPASIVSRGGCGMPQMIGLVFYWSRSARIGSSMDGSDSSFTSEPLHVVTSPGPCAGSSHPLSCMALGTNRPPGSSHCIDEDYEEALLLPLYHRSVCPEPRLSAKACRFPPKARLPGPGWNGKPSVRHTVPVDGRHSTMTITEARVLTWSTLRASMNSQWDLCCAAAS
jgi:hypothetical protein